MRPSPSKADEPDLRRRRRARRPGLPAAARADLRRHRRPRHLPRAARRGVDARRPHVGADGHGPDDRRRRRHAAGAALRARLRPRPRRTACSTSRPSTRCGASSASTGSSPTACAVPPRCRSLRQLGRKVTGGRPHLMREQELLRQSGPRLRGKRIVVDPGHGGPDRGVVSAGVARGRPDVGPRPAPRRPDERHRAWTRCSPGRSTPARRSPSARRSPTTQAPTSCCRCTSTPTRSMYAQGLATYHFGNGTGIDVDGRGGARRPDPARAADPHRRCTTAAPRAASLGAAPAHPDARRAGRSGLSVQHGRLRRLMDPAFRDVVAEGILVAVKRLYLLGQDDQPTGTFTFGDVLARSSNGTRPRPSDHRGRARASAAATARPSAPVARDGVWAGSPPRGRRSAAEW